MIQKRTKSSYLVILGALMLSACSASGDRQTEPKTVELVLHASKNSNPDRDGRAAPVQVLIYTLTNADNFSNSDYLTLSAGANPALLSDIKSQQQFILKPGESKTIKLDEVDKSVHFFGVAAAFRDINNARWNAVYALHKEKHRHWYQKLIPTSEQPLKLDITLDKLSVSITEAN